jgi:predicted N-acyltransferase
MSFNKEVKVFRSVSEIGKESIDSISNDGFFTFEWFKTLETQQSFDTAPIYVGVFEDGYLEALAPCFIDLQNHFFIDGPKITPLMKLFLTLGRKIGYCQEHVLLCYSPFCLRSKILLKKDPDGKQLLCLLSKMIDNVCKENRILFSSFLFVSEFDELLMKTLPNLGYQSNAGTSTFYLDVQWKNFEDYLKSLKQMSRHSIRREIRKCAENGVTIKDSDFKDFSEKLSGLTSNLLSKYNPNSDNNVFDATFFHVLNKYAADKTKVFIAEKNGEIVGFSLSMRQGDVLDVFMCGFDYLAQSSTDFTYFNLCYYAPIQWSIEQGIKKIYYRRKSDRAKLYRGCKKERTVAFVKCQDPVLGFCFNKTINNLVYTHLTSRILKVSPIKAS